MQPEAFAAALRAQLPTGELRAAFSGLEELHGGAHAIVDVAPHGGTLVLFDSVAVPHEVLTTRAGERSALAGWYHEEVQSFPEWFGS